MPVWAKKSFITAMLLSLSGFICCTASAAPSLWITPLELDFGPVGIGATGATFEVTITNTGDTILDSFAGGGVSPPFSVTQNCAGGVAPGASCKYFFMFSPVTAGIFTATSSSSTNAGPIRILLHGTGVGPGLHITATSLDFGSVRTGTTSATQSVTIRNTGLATLENFAGGGVSQPFSATQNCAGGVAPGGSCQYFFSFSPTAVGEFSATSSSTSSGGSFSIDLSGIGRSLIFGAGQRVTPRALDFGPIGVGDTSPAYEVTITNLSSFSPIDSFAGGGVSAPFSATQNCVPELAPLATCSFFYSFSPTAVGAFSTESMVSTSSGSFTITIEGEGRGPDLTYTPLVLDFGPVIIGNTSPSQAVTIRNTGMAPLANWAGGGVAAPFQAVQNCAGGVPVGESCQFFYSFNPVNGGRFKAVSNISTNGGNVSITLLGGETLSPQISKSFLPSTIRPGETAQMQLSIANPNQGQSLDGISLTDSFPAGMLVASPLRYTVSGECGTVSFEPKEGDSMITLSGITLEEEKTCTVSVDVTTVGKGSFTNTTAPVIFAGGTGGSGTASLQVMTPLTFLQLLLDDKD